MPRSATITLNSRAAANTLLLRTVFPHLKMPVFHFAGDLRDELVINEFNNLFESKKNAYDQLDINNLKESFFNIFFPWHSSEEKLWIPDWNLDSIRTYIEEEGASLEPKKKSCEGAVSELLAIGRNEWGDYTPSIMALSFYPRFKSSARSNELTCLGKVEDELTALVISMLIMSLNDIQSIDTFTYILNARSQKITRETSWKLWQYMNARRGPNVFNTEMEWKAYLNTLESAVEEKYNELSRHFIDGKPLPKFHEVMGGIADECLASLAIKSTSSLNSNTAPERQNLLHSRELFSDFVCKINEVAPNWMDVKALNPGCCEMSTIWNVDADSLVNVKKVFGGVGRFVIDTKSWPSPFSDALELWCLRFEYKMFPDRFELIRLEIGFTDDVHTFLWEKNHELIAGPTIALLQKEGYFGNLISAGEFDIKRNSADQEFCCWRNAAFEMNQ